MKLHYFIADYATGIPVEIFRSTLAGKKFSDGVIERAKSDGTWSQDDDEIKPLINFWLCGDFDPENDEISEQDAFKLLMLWRQKLWPGRK